MKNFLLLGLLLTASVAYADDTPSVLVQTQMPQRGSLAKTTTAYGTATPASSANTTIATQHDGVVQHLIVTPGERVTKGQPLLDFAASPAAMSAYQQAISALALAKKEQTHTAQLLQQQLATRDQAAQADKVMQDAENSFKALQRDGSGKQLETVAAPFDGIIVSIAVAPGDRVAANTALLTLAAVDNIILTVGIDPAVRAQVKPGQLADVIELVKDAQPVTGKVIRLDNTLNATSRLIDADIAVTDPLIIGQSYKASITSAQLEGWLMPLDAVLNDDKGDYVFQIVNNKAVRVEVTRLVTAVATIVVNGKLDPQKPLVISGNYQLADGMVVRQGNPAP